MTAYTPVEYQKRAAQREQRERELTELMQFTLWLTNAIDPTELDLLNWDQIQQLVEEFLTGQDANRV